jgi:hypothetical protein
VTTRSDPQVGEMEKKRDSQTDRNPSLHKTVTGQTPPHPKKGGGEVYKIYEIKTAMLHCLMNIGKSTTYSIVHCL